MEQDPIRARIRRLYIPNALYFIVAVVRDHRPVFADKSNVDLLRQTMRRVKEIHPFAMQTTHRSLPDEGDREAPRLPFGVEDVIQQLPYVAPTRSWPSIAIRDP